MAEALYRKYRPQIFEDVVGQEHIERTLKNAISQDKVSHAYLFCGPRGTGKTTTARLLAKALLCEKGPTPEPDGTCQDCEMIARGDHPDVYELDAASRTGVENVREEIIGRVQFAPTRGHCKIYIIDEVHMLSTAAFNALLKTLEEPPSHVVFILATTDPQKVPETIHSRCQRFDFHRISTEAMVSRLGAICVAEGVEFEGEALELVAHRADGGMRNALTSLEQLIAFGEGAVTREAAERMLGSVDSADLSEIVHAIGVRDALSCFRWLAEYVETGADLAQFVNDFALYVRNMYVLAVAGDAVVLDVSEATRRQMNDELALFGIERLARLLDILGDVSVELKTSSNQRLTFEIALTRMIHPDSDMTLSALAERVEDLERKLAFGTVAYAAPAQPQAASTPVDENSAASCAHADNSEGKTPDTTSVTTPTNVPVAMPTAAANAVVSQTATVPVETTSTAMPSAAPMAGTLPPQLLDSLRNYAALQRLWQSVLSAMKKSNIAYGVFFMNTKALFDETNACLVVEFSAGNEFVFKSAQKPEVQDELVQAIRKVTHVDIPVVLRQGASQTSPVAATSAGVAAASSSVANVPVSRPLSSDEPAQIVPDGGVSQAVAVPSSDPRFVNRQEHSAQAAMPQPQAVPDDVPPYDDYVPYTDEDAYGAPSTPDETPPWEDLPANSKQRDEPVGADIPSEENDINASLAFGFGTGVTFEEVD